MPNDATEAALGLLGLNALGPSSSSSSSSSLPSPSESSTIPLKRKQTSSSSYVVPPSLESDSTSNDSINCICGFAYDDGFSIGCDSCSRWCHAACFDIIDGNVPDEWYCWICLPRPVDKDRAVKLQKARQKASQPQAQAQPAAAVEKDKDKEKNKRRISPGVERKPRSKASASAIEGSSGGNAKRKRRSSVTVHHATAPAEEELINIDIDEPWTHSYVPISSDIIPQEETKDRLRQVASHWRGVTALQLSPSPTSSSPLSSSTTPAFLPPESIASTSHISLHPLTKSSFAHPALFSNVNPSILPPSYAVHAAHPISSSNFITPFTSTIIPSHAYLSDPLNAYAHLGMPKPFVHLFGPPLDVALDARIAGGKGRFVRSGCKPNAVLRPILCDRSGKGKGTAHDPPISFGVFALRDLKANEEVVLGWEWDDGSVVHHLPALIESPHKFLPDQLKYFRNQMMSMLHTLSSTFTTCACGAKAKDCALIKMAEFVDGQAPPTPSPSPPSIVVGDEQPFAAYDRERPRINTDTERGKKKDGKRVDLGPLVGVQRGFRTRERLPHSGGMYGVEMIPTPSDSHDEHSAQESSSLLDKPDRSKGKGRMRRRKMANENLEMTTSVGAASIHAHDSDDSADTSTKHLRHHTITSAYPSPVLSVSSPIASKRPLSPGDEIDIPEESMPPKMRKRWIYNSSDALRDDYANGESRTSSSAGTPTVAGAHTELSLDSRFAEDSGMDVDELTLDSRRMPPPPLPAARGALQTLTHLSSDLRNHHRHSDDQISPTISFAKLSLLSPVNPSAVSGLGMSPFFSQHQAEPSHTPQVSEVGDRPAAATPSEEALLIGSGSESSLPPVPFQSPQSLSQHSLATQQSPSSPLPPTSPLQQGALGSEDPDTLHDASLPEDSAMSVDVNADEGDEVQPVQSRDDPLQGLEDKTQVVRPPTPPPPKVKLSLKDFAMRKKKQREGENAKAADLVHPTADVSPLPPSTSLEEISSGDSALKAESGNEASNPNGSADSDIITPPSMNNVAVESIPHRESFHATETASARLPQSRDPDVHDYSPPSVSLQAKVELIEPRFQNGVVVPVNDYRAGVPLQPEPPPPSDHVAGYVNYPEREAHSLPSPPKFASRRPLSSRDTAQEDGEILSPPPQKPPLAPRSHTPPTRPRSFHTADGISSPSAILPPMMPIRRPLQPAPYRAHLQNQAPRPLPSAPRALRAVNRYSAHPVPRGPSADRERSDWERDRSWIQSSRGRGRGSSGSWGR